MEDTVKKNDGEEKSRSAETEKIGQYLRKVRTTLKIDLSELSRESKINLDYLKAMEANQFDKLPGSAYVRAYLKTLAKKYNLDGEKILKWYADETGESLPEKEIPTTLINMHDTSKELNAPKPKSFIFALFFVFIFLLISFNLYQKKRQNNAGNDGAVTVKESAAIPELSTLKDDSYMKDIDTALVDTSSIDTVKPITPVNRADGSISTAGAAAYTTVTFICRKDSSWAAVRSKGEKTWAQNIRPDKQQIVRRADTIHIEVGFLENVEIKLNGVTKPITKEMFKFYDNRKQLKVFNGEIIQ